MTGCSECYEGVLIRQEYGHTAVPDGWVPVQRCDTCKTFSGDQEAAAHLARSAGTEWTLGEIGFEPEPGDDPEDFPLDYIVRWNDDIRRRDGAQAQGA